MNICSLFFLHWTCNISSMQLAGKLMTLNFCQKHLLPLSEKRKCNPIKNVCIQDRFDNKRDLVPFSRFRIFPAFPLKSFLVSSSTGTQYCFDFYERMLQEGEKKRRATLKKHTNKHSNSETCFDVTHWSFFTCVNAITSLKGKMFPFNETLS